MARDDEAALLEDVHVSSSSKRSRRWSAESAEEAGAESIISQVDVDEGVWATSIDPTRVRRCDAVPAPSPFEASKAPPSSDAPSVVGRLKSRSSTSSDAHPVRVPAARRRDVRAHERLEPSNLEAFGNVQSVPADVQSSQARGVRGGGREDASALSRAQLRGAMGRRVRGERSSRFPVRRGRASRRTRRVRRATTPTRTSRRATREARRDGRDTPEARRARGYRPGAAR